MRGRARGGQRGAPARPTGLGRDPADLPCPDRRALRGGRDRGGQVIGAPPLRSGRDQAALWDGLRSGDIQAIGSDNTSWTVEQKAAGAHDFTRVPYGVPGLETEMRVIYSEGVAKGRIPLQTFVAAFSTNPARIFGLYPRKGTIAVGSDADSCSSIRRGRAWWTSGSSTRAPGMIPSTDSISRGAGDDGVAR